MLTLAIHRLWCFLGEERGSISVWSLFLFMTAGAIGAAAVDVTHVFAARTQLQVAADIAAHAAVLRRNQGTTSATAARLAAVSAVEFGMPEESYGAVIEDTDILFGRYDRATDTFFVDPVSRQAALVTTGREADRSNPVATLLFRFAGVDRMDVGASAVAEVFSPACLNGGFVAQSYVDIQSNNSFLRGFCVHSNGHVEMNNGNFFELGTVVSMPDLDDLVIPNSGMTQNTGLQQALREQEYELRILNRIRATSADPLDTAMTTLGTDDTPWYLTNATPLALSTLSPTPASFLAGHVYTKTCSSGQNINIGAGTYSQFVLLTNCSVQFSGLTTLEDVVISTTSTASDSFRTPSGNSNGLQIGKNDNCAARGGAQLITRGGFRGAAKVHFYDGQILALGNVEFAAQGLGVGASIVAGGHIDSTSNMDFRLCPNTPVEHFTADYIRLAR